MTALTRAKLEWELINVARWSSVIVALLVGYFFITDKWFWGWAVNHERYFADLFLKHRFDSGLIVLAMIGYTLAWRRKFETLGSIVALISIATVYLSYTFVFPPGPSPYLLALGIPAVFHLFADYLHRKTESALPR